MTAKSVAPRKRSLILGNTPEEKLWYGVDKTPGQGRDGDCWEWRYYKSQRVGGEYGHLTLGDTTYSTHRLAYELTYGAIPPGLYILHSCDNPPCCNPKHLRAGTIKENVQDALERGQKPTGDRHWTKHKPERIACGERQHSAKLTVDIVRKMRKLFKQGTSYAQLGREFNVAAVSAERAVKGQTWKHVKDDE